ncbi:MAG: hypothetical protein ACO391_09325 [Pseudomonadales bacterium]
MMSFLRRRWWLLLLVVALLTLGGLKFRVSVVNDRVIEEIKANPMGARAQRTMIVTLRDGRIFPVNYLVEDGRVYMGIDGLWWRAFQGEGSSVTLFIQGELIEGHATVILDDPARVKDVFSRLRPTVPTWLPDQLNGKLVEVSALEGKPSL